MKNAISFLLLMLYAFPAMSQDREKPLNVVLNQIEVKHYKSTSKDFGKYFTYLDIPAFDDFVYEQTSYTHLQWLIQQLPSAPQDTFIRMIRIIYGFDTVQNNIKLIYFPDYAVKQSLTSYQYIMGETPAGNATVYLRQQDGSFTGYAYNSTDVARLVFGYRQSGKLKFRNIAIPGNPTRPLDFASTERGDAKQVAFPFQEIETYFKDSTRILFTSIARTIEVDDDNVVKHCIAITGSYPQNITGNENAAADLGSLCPIRCNGFNLRHIFGGRIGSAVYPDSWGTETKLKLGQNYFWPNDKKHKNKFHIIERGNKYYMKPAK